MKRLVAACALATAGCSLLVSTSGLSDGADDPSGVDAAPDAPGPSSADGGGSDAAADGDASAPAAFGGPLVLFQTVSSLRCRVEGSFELEFPSNRNHAFQVWRDLTKPTPVNLGGSPLLFDAIRTTMEGAEISNATGTEGGYVDFLDETPVRVSFRNYEHHVLPSTADAKVWTRFTVYASGRVAIEVEVANPGGAAYTLPAGWQFHTTNLGALAWSSSDHPGGRAVTFTSPEGSSALLVNIAGVGTLAGAGGARRWDGSVRTIAAGGSLGLSAEIQVGVPPSAAAERALDVRNPELDVVAGGIGSYDYARGAYQVEATGGSITLALSASRLRANPAFEIRDLPFSSWKITQAGATIASSATPITSRGVARWDAAAKRLVFIAFGEIPTTAPLADRTITVEPL
ncbi:MAG: hypothetical protein KF819_10270 [Labilithrix sp.]|nr:hypothetical protein [Labilithrix sp.]